MLITYTAPRSQDLLQKRSKERRGGHKMNSCTTAGGVRVSGGASNPQSLELLTSFLGLASHHF